MLKLNLINPQQSDIAYKTMVFPDGQPHIKFDLSKIRGFIEGASAFAD